MARSKLGARSSARSERQNLVEAHNLGMRETCWSPVRIRAGPPLFRAQSPSFNDAFMKIMSGRRLTLLYLACLVTVSFGVLVSFHYNWPDFVHTDYGFPFVWATHTTTTIAGPVDKWNVKPTELFLNIVIWLSISFLVFSAGSRLASRVPR